MVRVPLTDLRHHLSEAVARLRELDTSASGGNQLATVLADLEVALDQARAVEGASLDGGADRLPGSEALYRAIFENAAVGIRLSDVHRGAMIVEANPAFHRLLGYADG